MNSQRLRTAPFPTLRLVDSDFTSEHSPAVTSEQAEGELLEALRSYSSIDADTKAQLEDGIGNETDLERLWFLLSSLDYAPGRTVDTELLFTALCRLLDSESPLIRFSAYRWLAGLYRIDLRFENRARLKLRDSLKVERGLMQERIRFLLKTC